MFCSISIFLLILSCHSLTKILSCLERSSVILINLLSSKVSKKLWFDFNNFKGDFKGRNLYFDALSFANIPICWILVGLDLITIFQHICDLHILILLDLWGCENTCFASTDLQNNTDIYDMFYAINLNDSHINFTF